MAGKKPKNLNQLLDAAAEAGGGSQDVSVEDLLDSVGHRSFGPLLLILALVAFTPLGAIPTLPTLLATMVILAAAQLMIGKSRFWLPGFVLRRSVGRGKLKTSIGYMRPVARFVDKLVKPRLAWLTEPPFVRIAAVVCILVALTVPLLEFVPFAGSIAWASIAAFGLALIADDGLLALIAAAFAIGTAFVIFTTIF